MDSGEVTGPAPDNYEPGYGHFMAEVAAGLQKPRKELPSKYFYDERGSKLFDCLCTLEEYYIPFIESSIMQTHINDIVKLVGSKVLLVEYGSGNCEKVRLLLENLHDPVAYIPIDISYNQLLFVAQKLASAYPRLQVIPVCADYLNSLELPVPERASRRTVVYFPGSTIGNFDPPEAKRFLSYIAEACGVGGGLLVGVDLKKDPVVLHNAYNDKEGVTAAFNTNLLERINRELGGDFQVENFRHYAFYNPGKGRVEMHLVSTREQKVHLDGKTITFSSGESIWTESSYKFNLDEFERVAASVGFRLEHSWTDERKWFSVQYLVKI